MPNLNRSRWARRTSSTLCANRALQAVVGGMVDPGRPMFMRFYLIRFIKAFSRSFTASAVQPVW